MPTSMNAACMPGSTRVTRPSTMLPTVPRAAARSIWSSAMMPSSMRATRVSRMSQLMTRVFRGMAFEVPRRKTPEFRARTLGRQDQRGVRDTTRLESGVVPDREANRTRVSPRAGETGRDAGWRDSRACVRGQDTGILGGAEIGKSLCTGGASPPRGAHTGHSAPGRSRDIPHLTGQSRFATPSGHHGQAGPSRGWKYLKPRENYRALRPADGCGPAARDPLHPWAGVGRYSTHRDNFVLGPRYRDSPRP